VQKRKDKKAAERFIKKLMKGQGRSAREIVTDKLPKSNRLLVTVRRENQSCPLQCIAMSAMQIIVLRYRMNPRIQVQVTGPGATIPGCSQSGTQALSCRPRSPSGCQLPTVDKSFIGNLAAGDVRLLNGKELICTDNFTFIGKLDYTVAIITALDDMTWDARLKYQRLG
jgi:hypothetical protein